MIVRNVMQTKMTLNLVGMSSFEMVKCTKKNCVSPFF